VWTEILSFSVESVERICEQINKSSLSFKYVDVLYVVGRLSISQELYYINLSIPKETGFELRVIIHRAVHALGTGLLVLEARVVSVLLKLWTWIAHLVQILATDWTVRGSNPGGARFYAPVQNGPKAHPASYTMGSGSFPGVKRPGRIVDHPPPSSAEVKERAELYLYSPVWALWPVLG
jgi:hypothetical protein